ncbi:hypothetical protein [Demequina flava]|uniref:hypothetical protein n=1 Tax=Demequina flava TaxID=1095025 RepID=UPI000786484A|nr:hypothetical protein [Demequina flava]
MSKRNVEMQKKDLRERDWELAADDDSVTVFRSRRPWATWVPVLLVILFFINTYREVATTDNLHNTILASIIWGVALLGPAAWIFWLWGYDRKRPVARMMNRKDVGDGVAITLRDTKGMRHDFVVPPDEADRLERLLGAAGEPAQS